MDASELNFSWLWISGGILLGIPAAYAGIVYLGKRVARRMGLDDRGDYNQPLPHPFPPERVIAVYKRRKWYHRHDRRHYQRERSRSREHQ